MDQQIYRTAVEAARRKFTPEFMNRIDKVVCLRSLKENHLRKILDLELQAVQERVMFCAGNQVCVRVLAHSYGDKLFARRF